MPGVYVGVIADMEILTETVITNSLWTDHNEATYVDHNGEEYELLKRD